MQHNLFRAARGIVRFAHFFGYQVANGYLPNIGHYRGDYDCGEHYFLGWYAPEHSHLKLHYYHMFNPRTQQYEFVYNPPNMNYGHNRMKYGVDEYDDICF